MSPSGSGNWYGRLRKACFQMNLELFLMKNLWSDFEDHERLSKSWGCKCPAIFAQVLVVGTL